MNKISSIAENSYVAWLTIAQQIDANFTEVSNKIPNMDNYLSSSEIAAEYATKSELEEIKLNGSDLSVDDTANTIQVNSTKYTLVVDKNVLSVQQYVPTVLSKVVLGNVSYTATATGGGVKYVGTTYETVCGIKFNDTTQVITSYISNPKHNKFKIAIHNGLTYVYNDTSWRTGEETIYLNINHLLNDVSNQTRTGTVSWGIHTNSTSVTNLRSFTVYLTESNNVSLKTVSQSQISTTQQVIAKVPIMKGKDATYINCKELLTDVEYKSTIGNIVITDVEFNANEVPTIAVPTCLGKTLEGYDGGGTFKDISWKVYTTGTYTLNGCTTKYDIYCVCNPDGTPKKNAGKSKNVIKLV